MLKTKWGQEGEMSDLSLDPKPKEKKKPKKKKKKPKKERKERKRVGLGFKCGKERVSDVWMM